MGQQSLAEARYCFQMRVAISLGAGQGQSLLVQPSRELGAQRKPPDQMGARSGRAAWAGPCGSYKPVRALPEPGPGDQIHPKLLRVPPASPSHNRIYDISHAHTHTYAHTYTHTHTCTHMHTHAHACTHMHTHTHTFGICHMRGAYAGTCHMRTQLIMNPINDEPN